MSGLRLLAAAPTPALRRAVFGGDDDLDQGGLRAALALSVALGGPADSATGTADASPRRSAATHPDMPAFGVTATPSRTVRTNTPEGNATVRRSAAARDGTPEAGAAADRSPPIHGGAPDADARARGDTTGSGRADVWLCGPSQAARQTVRALGHAGAAVQPRLADPDYGSWSGQSLDEIARTDPDGLQAWLTDPEAAPHGGESLAALRRRVGAWLDAAAGQRAVAVAHPVVIRAALAHALGLPDQAVWQLDVAPLSLTRLTHRAGRWHVSFPPANR